jgi:cysteine-rich repeat protein
MKRVVLMAALCAAGCAEFEEPIVCPALVPVPHGGTGDAQSEHASFVGTIILEGSCVGHEAYETAFLYTPTAEDEGKDGTLTIDWSGYSTSDVGLVVRRVCEDATEVACVPSQTASPLALEVERNEPLVLILESTIKGAYAGSAAMQLALDVTFEARERCGNGVLDPGEACDDGDDDALDGCDGGCRVGLCVGAEPGVLGANEGTTAGGEGRFFGDCRQPSLGGGGEHVYRYPILVPSTLELAIDAEAALYVTQSCSAEASVDSTDPAGGASCAAPSQGSLLAPVLPGEAFVVVDAEAAPGPYRLDVDIVPACGNGAIDAWAAEECDDGARHDGDGCSATCAVEWDVFCAAPPLLELGLTEGDTLAGGAAVSHGIGCNAADAAYRFEAPGPGTLWLALGAAHDATLKVSTLCGDWLFEEQSCVNGAGPGENEIAHVTVAAGATVWIFVDGNAPEDSGAYALTAHFIEEEVVP